MTPFTSVNSVIAVTVKGYAEGQQIYNVLNYVYTGPDLVPPPLADLDAFLDLFRTAWRTAVLPNLSQAYYVSEYTAQEIVDKVPSLLSLPAYPYKPQYGSFSFLEGNVGADVGLLAEVPETTFTCCTVRHRTGVSNRRYRGSMHFGPLCGTQVDGRLISLFAQGAFQASSQALSLFLVPAGVVPYTLEMVCFSRRDFFGPGTAAPPQPPRGSTRVVTQHTTNVLAGSVLHRKPRRLGF